MLDYLILIDMKEKLEQLGCRNDEHSFELDEEYFSEFKNHQDKYYTYEQFLISARRCLSNNWIEPSHIGPNPQYRLTARGDGIARSKRESLREQANKPLLKKIEEFLDAKGLTFLGKVFWAAAGSAVTLVITSFFHH